MVGAQSVMARSAAVGQSPCAARRSQQLQGRAAPCTVRLAARRVAGSRRVARVAVRAGLNNGSSSVTMPSKPQDGVPLDERALRMGLPSKVNTTSPNS